MHRTLLNASKMTSDASFKSIRAIRTKGRNIVATDSYKLVMTTIPVLAPELPDGLFIFPKVNKPKKDDKVILFGNELSVGDKKYVCTEIKEEYPKIKELFDKLGKAHAGLSVNPKLLIDVLEYLGRQDNKEVRLEFRDFGGGQKVLYLTAHQLNGEKDVALLMPIEKPSISNSSSSESERVDN